MTILQTATSTNGATADRYGYPLTTTAAAAAAYRQGVETLLAVQPGAAAAFGRAVRLDPGFALGHIGLALAVRLGGDAGDTDAALAAARAAADSASLTRRERQHVEIVGAGLALDLARAGALTLEHLQEFPCDIPVTFQLVMAAHFAGDEDLRTVVATVVDGLSRHHPDDDWAFAALHAFVLEEEGDDEGAEALARRSLSLEPRSGQGAHVLAHVLYETDRHDEALEVLTRWLGGYPLDGPMRIHLQWHLALVELARGDTTQERSCVVASSGWPGPDTPAPPSSPRCSTGSPSAASSALAHFELAGDRWGRTKALEIRAQAHLDVGDLDRADADNAAGARLAAELDNDDCIGALAQQRGLLELLADRPAPAAAAFEEAVSIGRRMDNRPSLAFPLNGLGMAARRLGDADTAVRCHREALELYEGTPLPLGAPYTRACLALALVDQGHTTEAAELARAALDSPTMQEAPDCIAFALEAAAAASLEADPPRAASLLSAARAHRAQAKRSPAVPTIDMHDHRSIERRLAERHLQR